jgi:ribosomal-protein-alanine N-acetyltransferase
MMLFLHRNVHQRQIEGSGLVLRAPVFDDFSAWQALRAESAAFLIPWEPRWPVDDLTRSGFKRRLRRYQHEARNLTGITWFVFSAKSNELLGGLSLSSIRYGAAGSCQLGYWMGERHAGRGVMKKAVAIALGEAFGRLGLQRVEAVSLPENARSISVLEGAGFRREGFVRSYLEINGERRDHVLFAILRSDFIAGVGHHRPGGLKIAEIAH